MAGKTDFQIMRDGLNAYGLNSTDGNVRKMANEYLDFLEIEIENPFRHVKPGIVEILNLLRKNKMSIGLLTGNLERGAKIKLSPFGLNEFFLDGAFGSDHEDRDLLLPIALKKFSRRGFEFAARDCIVIGDTPRDVRCAKIHGAYSIAVATGPYTKEDLLNTDADIILDSLANVEECMNFIINCN
jgi:phosphoglycolate phosphatase-like HAD superfamily hydrolase